MSYLKATVLATFLLQVISAPVPADENDVIASIRRQFAEDGKLTIELDEKKVPYGKDWDPVTEIEKNLIKQPRGAVTEAIDQAIVSGNKEERIGALSIYLEAVYMKRVPSNPRYRKNLLDLLAEDDLKVKSYTGSLVGTLWTVYPSRETVFAFMEAAKRASTHEMRITFLKSAAGLCKIEWLDIQPESRGPRVEKVLADFEDWFAKNRDRIQFNKEGQFKLSRNTSDAKPVGLREEDRKLIRQDPVCVLRLMKSSFGEDDNLNHSKELASKCGAALWGVEGARAMSRALSEAEASPESQANLASLAGEYPMQDAATLAAVYIVAYQDEKDGLEMAKDFLIRVNPKDVQRVGKGEPRWVVKKAEALANPARP
jgi:hypothetical protein